MKINLQEVKTVLMNPKIPGNMIEKNTTITRATVSLYRKGEHYFGKFKLRNAASIQEWIDGDKELQSLLKELPLEDVSKDNLVEILDMDKINHIISLKEQFYHDKIISNHTKLSLSDVSFIRNGRYDLYGYPLDKISSVQEWLNEDEKTSIVNQVLSKEKKLFQVGHSKQNKYKVYVISEGSIYIFIRPSAEWVLLNNAESRSLMSKIYSKGIVYCDDETIEKLAAKLPKSFLATIP